MRESLPIRAGSLELIFDPETLFVRRISWGGEEIVRAIYVAVRDKAWRTIPPRLTAVECKNNEHEFSIRLEAECVGEGIQYAWEGIVAGNSDGQFHFEFNGIAGSDFLRNRIGLCVLHPGSFAGRACEVEHSDHRREFGCFPELISPFQPFFDIRRLRYAANEHTNIEIHFEGETFEMEDQRNWSDASFKTYGTPLSLPFPALVRIGEKSRQAVTVRVRENPKSRAPVEHEPGGIEGTDEIPVRIDFSHLRQKPLLGFGACTGTGALPSRAAEKLRALHPDHIRVDCRMWESDWKSRLTEAAKETLAIGADLHVAAFLEHNKNEALRDLAATCTKLESVVKLWLLFVRGEKCTPEQTVKLARDILGRIDSKGEIAAGTDLYFAELNRERPPAEGDWHPCFSLNPQVHATDNWSLNENLESQGDIVRSAASFCRQTMVISPITLLPRFNPNAAESSTEDRFVDARQSTLFAAAWTLGSIEALTSAPEGLHSLTYFQTVGPGGIMDSQGNIYPMYHVFAGIAELHRLAEINVGGAPNLRAVSAIGGEDESGRKILWIANHQEKSVNVQIQPRQPLSMMHVKRLGQEDLRGAAEDPDWWKRDVGELRPGSPVTIPSHGLARVELH